MSAEFTPEGEEPEVADFEYPDTLDGPDAVFHFGVDAQTFLLYWCTRLGQEAAGSVVSLCEGASMAVLELATGQWMTPEAIVKREREAKRPRSVT